MKLYMFRRVPLSIIRSFSLYTQQWYMSYRFADSCKQLSANSKQWKTPDDGQRNCPKRVEFHSKNKFVKLVHLVGFITKNSSRRTVTRTSNSCNVAITRRTNRKPSNKQCTCGNQKALDRKVLSLVTQGRNHMLAGAELYSVVCRH